MPGMNAGLGTNNPAIVSAFHAALVHQGLILLLVLALVAVAWNVLRSAQLRQARAASPLSLPAQGPKGARWAPATPEPAGRHLLRVFFGVLWIFDGILQGQASMPLGMVPRVVQPAASASPGWAQSLVNAGETVWSYHPVSAAAAAVWIQVGIGAWLLVAPRGDWSRLAGVASAAWGLVVWIFGESLGGILAPGASWLFGTPGAVLFYCLAGVLVALPERAWTGPRLGRALLRALGLFFLGMALLQAWPGRGSWQGQARPTAAPGALVSMVRQMAQTPQPHLLSSWVAAFGRFDAAHGWAVNLFVVVALAGLGAASMTAKPPVARFGLYAAGALCLATWLLVQDLGFMGGVGTDPNSMLPTLLLLVAGYLAATSPSPSGGDAPVPTAGAGAGAAGAGGAGTGDNAALPAAASARAGMRARILSDPAYSLRAVAALGAIGVTLMGVVPMAVASAEPRADQLLAQALDGAPQPVDSPAAPFALTDQHGRAVSLAALRGRTVALTFLDDTCTTDCPLIAQEFRTADGYLGAAARHVVMVAVNANPRFVAPGYLAAFDRQEGLLGLPNWLYLTGSLPELRRVWKSYGEDVQYLPGGAMVLHSEYAWVIDAEGHTRDILGTDPGFATKATSSSFAAMLAATIVRVAHQR